MAEVDWILDSFHNDLDRAKDLLNLTALFRSFAGSKVPDDLNPTIWPESVNLADIAPRVRTDLPILSGSIQLYLCGRFEYFVREVIEAIVDRYAADSQGYNDLPDCIVDALRRQTLEVAKTPRRFRYNESEVPRLLDLLSKSLNRQSTAAVEIESRLLSITQSNMNPDTLSELFKQVGISGLWKEIGKQASLKSYLSHADDEQCTKAAKARLSEIMSDRNSIAHPTSGTTFPDPDQVLEHVDFFRALSKVIGELSLIPR